MSPAWAPYANLLWAAWLVSNATAMEYPSRWLLLSEVASGAIVIGISVAMVLTTRFHWLRWVNCAVGTWLLFAPLVFWTPSPAVYAGDTLLGALIIFCSATQRSDATSQAHDLPQGWSYNPSEWRQRVPIIGLAFLGFFLARYLAAYQLRHVSSAWDPFFGDGTMRILTSDVSRAFPISDAGLGALSYLLDAVSGAIGDRRRWRTMPWMVVLFGLMIIPPGVTSIVLVMLQPLEVGAWCSICLFTALVMLAMVPPAVDEVVATVLFLRQARRAGLPFWHTFWRGHATWEPAPEPSRPALPELTPTRTMAAIPWRLAVSSVIGAWLMAAPWAFGLTGAMRALHFIGGALVITFSIIGLSDAARPFRLANIPVGLCLAIASLTLGDGGAAPRMTAVVCGLLVVWLNIPAGPFTERLGGYDRVARWAPVRGGPNRPKRSFPMGGAARPT